MVDMALVLIAIVLIGGGVMVVRSELHHLHPYDVGDMKAIDPSPGLPQVNYLNRTWEATHIRLHANEYKFDLRLRRGRDEERLATFDINQFTELHSLISIFFPRGPVTLDVVDGNNGANANAEGGVNGEKMGVRALLMRNSELQLERDSFEYDLLRLRANFRDELERRWRDMMDMQEKGGAGGGGKKEPK